MASTPATKAQSSATTELCANQHTTRIDAGETSYKQEATMIAAFALRGVAVHRLASGGYLACQWTFTRHCRDLQELAAFAKKVGAA